MAVQSTCTWTLSFTGTRVSRICLSNGCKNRKVVAVMLLCRYDKDRWKKNVSSIMFFSVHSSLFNFSHYRQRRLDCTQGRRRYLNYSDRIY